MMLGCRLRWLWFSDWFTQKKYKVLLNFRCKYRQSGSCNVLAFSPAHLIYLSPFLGREEAIQDMSGGSEPLTARRMANEAPQNFCFLRFALKPEASGNAIQGPTIQQEYSGADPATGPTLV